MVNTLEVEMTLPPEHDYERYYKLKPGDIYVEIGGFLARHGAIASKKGAKVYLIEPSPDNIAIIEKRILNEDLNNIKIIKKAMWSERKRMLFRVEGPTCGHSLTDGVGNECPGLHSIEVDADTLDNIFDELGIKVVDLLSADCEGGEIHITRSANKFMNEGRILNIAIGAYHHPDNAKIVFKQLERKGFKDLKYEPENGTIYGHI